jgi:hypothetical protein
MNTKTKKSIDLLEEKLKRGTKQAIKILIQERKKTNDHLVVSRNGKVVKVKARSLK